MVSLNLITGLARESADGQPVFITICRPEPDSGLGLGEVAGLLHNHA